MTQKFFFWVLIQKKEAYISKKTCMWIVKASSFVASRIWKESKRSSIGKYINKLEYIHNMKYYSKVKSNATFIYVKTWLNFTNMMPCEKKWKRKLLSHVRLFATHGLYSPWNSPGQNTGVGSLFLLQGIFPTQGLNPGLPHCRWILYQLSHSQT